MHTIGTNLFVLTCFISRLVRIVGLDPARGHSKLDYLSYCLLMQFFDIWGGTKIVGEGLGLGDIWFGCA